MDKIDLLIIIGNEVCEGCGPHRDCGEEITECFRIGSALKSLDEFMGESNEKT